MFTKRLWLVLLTILFALVGIGLVAGSAGAGSLMITDEHGAMWTASWDKSLDKVLSLTGPTAGGAGIGTLTKKADFMPGVKSMEILFTQTSVSKNPDKDPDPPGVAGNDFGLRFSLNEMITNNTGKAWSGFTEALVEVNPQLVSDKDKKDFPADAMHPWFAHFHNFKADNFKPGDPPFKLDGKFPEAGDLLKFTGGPLDGNGGKWNPTGIGIHERIFGDVFKNDVGRQFKLIETAIFVPEPTSIIMLALGLATIGYAWRRRNSALSA